MSEDQTKCFLLLHTNKDALLPKKFYSDHIGIFSAKNIFLLSSDFPSDANNRIPSPPNTKTNFELQTSIKSIRVMRN